MKIPPPVAELIGFERLSFGDGKCTMRLEAGEQHSNPMGTLHGGILCDLADGAMGMAFFSTCAEGETFTTLELKINFLKPVCEPIQVREYRPEEAVAVGHQRLRPVPERRPPLRPKEVALEAS